MRYIRSFSSTHPMLLGRDCTAMGPSISRRSEPEVHVVVVQSQENGQVDAKVIRKSYHKSDAHIYHGECDQETVYKSHVQDRYNSEPKHGHHSFPDGIKSQPVTSKNYSGNQPQSRVLQHLRLSASSRESRRELTTSSYINLKNKDFVSTETQKKAYEELSPTSEAAPTTFELFRTYDGEEFTVYMRDDGKRFYVDFEEQKWRYFPTSWEKRGYFQAIDYDPYENSESTGKGEQFSDSRSGEFIHPTRGKLVTYLRQEMLNMLYFLDETSGTWLPMPINWERHVPNVASIIEKVQKACPHWKDTKAIVALLRQSNYNVEDCISTFISLNDDGVLDTAEDSGRDSIRTKLERQLADTRYRLKQMTEKHKELEMENEIFQTKLKELERESTKLKRETERKLQDQRTVKHTAGFRMKFKNPSVVKQILRILQENAHTLQAKVSSLQNTVAKGLRSYRAVFEKLATGMSQLVRVYRRQEREIGEVRALYQKEALHRKLLYNEVQELKGNIRVFCRCRYDNRAVCALRFDASGVIICPTGQGRKKVYDLEKIFPPDSTQEEVFEDTKAIITSCVDGYNVCIIAYGQTGAGKTYTMMGTRDQPGVNIRSMKELFRICKEKTKVKYSMKVSIVEVYNEAIFDLLVPLHDGHEKLQIIKKGKETFVQGLIEIEVRTMDDIVMVMQEGEQNRTVADTKMNTNSSRSHQVLMLRVEGYDQVSKTTSQGRLTLVDLAGSERISRSEATGIRLVEAASINKSLSALGQVFSSIRNNALHIPYRNSKLTFLLQPSIGGDSKVCVFVNISPLESNMAETISTLEFGQNVRQVELGKAQKHITRTL